MFNFILISKIFAAFTTSTVIRFNKLSVAATHSLFQLIYFQGFQLFAAFVELALRLSVSLVDRSAKLFQRFNLPFCLSSSLATFWFTIRSFLLTWLAQRSSVTLHSCLAMVKTICWFTYFLRHWHCSNYLNILAFFMCAMKF